MTDNNNLAKGDASPLPFFPKQENEKAYEGYTC